MNILLEVGLDHPVSACRYEGPTGQPTPVLVLAHGAGAPQGHPFMTRLARAIADRGADVWTFNFPYMDARRRVPDRMPVLAACFSAVLAHVIDASPERLVYIGGKSMGGRVATHIAAHASTEGHLAGVVCLGYPLTPPSGAKTDRTSHLAHLAVPVLVVQGTRDPFGGPDQVRAAFASARGPVTVVPVDGGGHSFEGPRRRGVSQDEVHARVASSIVAWMK
jgi:predicted alpha/beta-hydrolase family hydrolase